MEKNSFCKCYLLCNDINNNNDKCAKEQQQSCIPLCGVGYMDHTASLCSIITNSLGISIINRKTISTVKENTVCKLQAWTETGHMDFISTWHSHPPSRQNQIIKPLQKGYGENIFYKYE